MAEPATTTAATTPSLKDTLFGLLNKAVDTAATYGAAKLQADATKKAAEAAYRSDLAASRAAAAGTTTPTPSALPSWVAPVGIGVGALALVAVVVAIFRRS